MAGSKGMEQATKWMRLATSKMQLLDVEPSPHNYAVFFQYFAALQPLKNELDRLLGKQVVFTPEVCEELYVRHLEKDSGKLREVKEAIRALIAQMGAQLKDLVSDMNGYDKTLAACEATLEGGGEGLELESLKELVSTLLTETRHARDTCQASSEVVGQLNAEIDSLRSAIEQMSEEVLEDALTGIGNRRAFDLELGKMLSPANADGGDFCLLLLDIDNFKSFNDEHGHLVGDMVLRYVAQMIKRGVKGRDVVTRYGGEEFGVILPRTGYDGGMSVAHAITDTVANRALTVGKDKRSVGKVTLSVGLSLYCADDTTTSIISRADQSLYAAKARGRNIVVGEKALL